MQRCADVLRCCRGACTPEVLKRCMHTRGGACAKVQVPGADVWW